MKLFLLVSALLTSTISFANTDVIFHPKGPTLENIADWISKAQKRVDIAMYNMETTSKSPIIATLQSPAIQNRIRNKDLQIRLIFEGYGTPAENAKNMENLENLGIDVRFMSSAKKVHHKFAVIDSETSHPRLISGSANWSLSSRANYHENIVFFENEPTVTYQYQSEFELLWNNAKEFGRTLGFSNIQVPNHGLDQNLQVHFNSSNYNIAQQRISLKRNFQPALTSLIVNRIDSAKRTLDIATTRIKIKEINDALNRAAQRGVQIRIIVSMDEYRCSPGKSYSRELSRSSRNIQLRIKYYNLDPCEYLNNQMHNKYMIVDNELLLTGSFNWSTSAETDHIENVIEAGGRESQYLVNKFAKNFSEIWNFNRNSWQQQKIQITSNSNPPCTFTPTVLTVKEIDELYATNKNPKCTKN